MSLRSLTATNLDKSRLRLCARCSEGKIVGGACMLGTCKGCNRGLDRALAYCSLCAQEKERCQRCTDSLKTTPQSSASSKAIVQKPARAKISLIEYLESQAQEHSVCWEDYASDLAGSIDEAMDGKYKRNTIRISNSPCINRDERRRVNSALSEAGYGQETRDLVIGEIYRKAKSWRRSQS